MKRMALPTIVTILMLGMLALSVQGATGATEAFAQAPADTEAVRDAVPESAPATRWTSADLSSSGSTKLDEPRLDDIAPEFIADDDSFPVQRSQIAMHLRNAQMDTTWRNHMAPAFAVESDSPYSMPPYTPAELEEFRGQLSTFSVDLQGLVAYFPDEQRLDMVERLEYIESAIPVLTHEQLAQMRFAFSEYPGYWNVPTHMLNRLQSEGTLSLPGAPAPFDAQLDPELGPQLEPGLEPKGNASIEARPTVPPWYGGFFEPSPQYTGCFLFAYGGICDMCPPGLPGGLVTIFALDVAAFIADITCEFLPEDILTGSASIPNPGHVICVGIRQGLKIAAEGARLIHDMNGECEDGVANNIVHWYLDETVSSRASQQSHDYHHLTDLRLSMEHDLLNLLDTRVSKFQLPEDHGGYIDRIDDLSIRWIVLDTIEMQEAAGYTGEQIRNARDEYHAAEAHLSNGEYKSAYARYRKAYRAAVRVGRER